MNLIVLLKMVPDVIEELEIDPGGRGLDTSFLRWIVNERDEHALEQALLLKERHGGTVAVVGLDAEGMEDVLFTAVARGADRAVRVEGLEAGLPATAAARAFASALRSVPGLWPADLVLTGVSAIDDLDGQPASILARTLEMPYCGVVTSVTADPGASTATFLKEFAGGVRGRFETGLPAILGVQSAEKPPRYVPVAKVRQAMKTARIETAPAPEAAGAPAVEVLRMAKPESRGRAEMFDGPPEEAAARIVELLAARGSL